MSPGEGGEQARTTADAVARRSYGKLVAFLAARTRDVASVEDALSEAFAAKRLADWPVNGCPANPEGWLLTAARRKLIDFARRRRTGDLASGELQRLAEELEAATNANTADAVRFPITARPDVCLRASGDLMAGVRAPLILQTLLGLDAAMDCLGVSHLANGHGPTARFEPRTRSVRPRFPSVFRSVKSYLTRLGAVLDAIYAAFSEGWVDSGGTDAARRDMAEEALFLGQLLTQLLPQEPEALGLWR